MEYFPLFFKLEGAPCLLVGGGAIATRKARLINKAGARLFVFANKVEPELLKLVEQSGGAVLHGEWQDALLDDKKLVIAATNDEALNASVAAACQKHNIPVNVVDQPGLCSVIMPAIVDRSPVVVAVSSFGKAPVLARKVRTHLESSVPASYGKLANLMGSFRDKVASIFPEDLRRRFWESVVDGPVGEAALKGDMALAERLLSEKVEAGNADSEGEVYLVGAGPGDPDLLTFKALRLMQKADVVLYDRLVSPPILEMVRRDAERIYVGKQRAEHAVPQQAINEMLLELALEGKKVLRLKGGDPFIFGRGGEEISLLAENNVAFQVVPGITAASGCACYAGIPLTHRDYSQSVRFITGHLKSDAPNLKWGEFVDKSQTLVFYMGLGGLNRICARLVQHGKDPETPAALIERGTLPEQKIHIGTIETLPSVIQGKEIHAPTLLIIGDVVHLHASLKH